MMEPFTSVTGVLAPLPLDNINTDQICPVSGHNYGSTYSDYLFHEQRFSADGREIGDFVLNRPEYRAARFLLAGQNFGCGSGRETAVWALSGVGIRCVVALSFADIFRENCLRNGVLPLPLPAEDHATLLAFANTVAGGLPVTIDLEQCIIQYGNAHMPFSFDEAERQALLRGLDDIGVTLQFEADIGAWERRKVATQPWLQAVPRAER